MNIEIIEEENKKIRTRKVVFPIVQIPNLQFFEKKLRKSKILFHFSKICTFPNV